MTLTDVWLVVEATLVHGVVRLLILLLPFHAARRLVACAARVGGRRGQPAARLAWAIAASARHTGHGTCLTQALAAQVLLAWHGHSTRLRLGVAVGADHRLQAHAWLESGEAIVLGGRIAPGFQPLADFEAGR